jgi:hypothetical protein
MQSEEFNEVLDMQINRCVDVLKVKSDEYSSEEDRLHNFKVAATLRGVSVIQALSGMMAKHTVSIYDMCESDFDFSSDVWDEKITDHINYLLLLRAAVVEKTTTIQTVQAVHL